MKILYVLGFMPSYVQRELACLAGANNEIVVLLPADDRPSRSSSFWKNIVDDPESGNITIMRELPFSLLSGSPAKLMKPLAGSLHNACLLPESLRNGEARYFLVASEALKLIPRRWKPDVIHSHFAMNQAHVARIMAKRLGVPYTVTTHATDIFACTDTTRLRRVLSRASEVVTISEYNSRFMAEKGYDTKRTEVIKLGTDVQGLPERNRVPGKMEAVCVASGLVEKKGIPVLLEASRMLKTDHPDLHFTVIGSDPEGILLERYRKEAEALPVTFTGLLTLKETLARTASASLFVLPCVKAENGDMDGIPVAIMEAMGIGVPVVSTAISGVPELIQHEESGLLAPPGSAGILSEMIARILKDPDAAEEMGQRGREQLVRNHSPETAAKKLMTVFRRVTGVEE